MNRVFQTIGQKLTQSTGVQNLSQRITTRLLLSYSIPLLCLAALGGVTYGVARETVEIEAERTKLQSAEYDFSEASYYLSDATRQVNAYTLRPAVSSYGDLYSESYENYLEHLSALMVMAESQQDKALIAILETFEKETHRLNVTAERMIEQIESGNPQSALVLVSRLDSVPVEAPRNALQDHLIERLEENTAQFDAAQKRLFRTLIGGTALAFLTTVVLGFVTMRQLRYQMHKMVGVVEQSGIQVTTSSTQIAASSRQLEASVTEQAASATEISATATEISATADSLSKTMVEVMALSDAAGVTASEGKQSLSRMEATIHQLTAATATISSKLGQIDGKANNISAVVTAITKVADQTNLLSLNAAIEAEKAGEYGAGFSVVAREIRRLADQTAIATLEIEKMVKEMLSSVATGVMEMDRFSQEVTENATNIGKIGEQISLIIAQVESLAPQFETVTMGMSAQAESAQQICSAMAQLDDSSQQTAESVKDTNQAIGQLSEVVQDLQLEVANFKVAV